MPSSVTKTDTATALEWIRFPPTKLAKAVQSCQAQHQQQHKLYRSVGCECQLLTDLQIFVLKEPDSHYWKFTEGVNQLHIAGHTVTPHLHRHPWVELSSQFPGLVNIFSEPISNNIELPLARLTLPPVSPRAAQVLWFRCPPPHLLAPLHRNQDWHQRCTHKN